MRTLVQRATPERPRFGVIHRPGSGGSFGVPKCTVWAVEILGLATVVFRNGSEDAIATWCARNDVVTAWTV